MSETLEKISVRRPSPVRAFFQRIEIKLAIKTGLAASLSLLIGLSLSDFLNRPDTMVSGLWCVMTAIVVLQAHIGGTYKAAWQRFLGVLIGVIIGGFFTSFIEKAIRIEETIIDLGLSAFFTILICSIINIKESFRIASMSTAVVVILAGLHPEINPWTFSFYRFLDSCIGIMVAITIAHVLWPAKATENLRRNLGKASGLISKYYRLAIDQTSQEASTETADELFAEIEGLLFSSRDILGESQFELPNSPDQADLWTVVLNRLESIFETVVTLRHAHTSTLEKMFDDSLAHQVSDVVDKTDLVFQDTAKIIEMQAPSTHLPALHTALHTLSEEMTRFRGTRTTRKFNLEDVENFFVFFYSLRSIGEDLIKLDEHLQSRVNT